MCNQFKCTNEIAGFLSELSSLFLKLYQQYSETSKERDGGWEIDCEKLNYLDGAFWLHQGDVFFVFPRFQALLKGLLEWKDGKRSKEVKKQESKERRGDWRGRNLERRFALEACPTLTAIHLRTQISCNKNRVMYKNKTEGPWKQEEMRE